MPITVFTCWGGGLWPHRPTVVGQRAESEGGWAALMTCLLPGLQSPAVDALPAFAHLSVPSPPLLGDMALDIMALDDITKKGPTELHGRRADTGPPNPDDPAL